MAEINLSTMIYMSIVMGMVVISLLGFVGSLSSLYGKSPDLSSINKTISVGESMKSTYQNIQQEQPQTSILGSTGLLITGANLIWKYIILFLTVPDLIGSLISDFAGSIGIPPIFTAGAFFLIISAGIFAVLRILAKTEV